MSNHFHLLIQMLPESEYSDEDIRNRYESFFGDAQEFSDDHIPYFRQKWSSLSEFIKEIKQNFTRFYNKRHNRRGTLWGERFKSVIVEKGETLINCLAYIDLNPVRADLVDRPEEYRWCSLAYHIQTGNRCDFLSLDFGLKEFGEMNDDERLQRYRQYVYETGAVNTSEKVINEKVVKKEKRKGYKITRLDRFKYRTRYFTDSGIIGTKEYVSQSYQRFKDIFYSKKEKIPKSIVGLDGIYSLKRLTE